MYSKAEYIKNVVLPYYENMRQVNYCWALRNSKYEFILCSNEFVNYFSCLEHEIIGKSIDNIIIWSDKFKRSEQKLDDLAFKYPERIHSIVDTIDLKSGMEVPFIAQHTAIKYKNQPVAIEIKYSILNQELNIRKYKKLLLSQSLASSKFDLNLGDLNQREQVIVYLLLLRKTQQEIAALCNLSRARIAQIIARICEKCNISGVSAKVLVDCAISHKIHEKIPHELLTLSKLY